MSNQDQKDLLLSAIALLKTQSTSLSLPCLALSISYHYRTLSKISQRKKKEEYQEQARFWFLCYMKNRCHSRKTRLMLLDQVIYSHSLF
jgi:tRNA G26 N,N-dimethylase Trm1